MWKSKDREKGREGTIQLIQAKTIPSRIEKDGFLHALIIKCILVFTNYFTKESQRDYQQSLWECVAVSFALRSTISPCCSTNSLQCAYKNTLSTAFGSKCQRERISYQFRLWTQSIFILLPLHQKRRNVFHGCIFMSFELFSWVRVNQRNSDKCTVWNSSYLTYWSPMTRNWGSNWRWCSDKMLLYKRNTSRRCCIFEPPSTVVLNPTLTVVPIATQRYGN